MPKDESITPTDPGGSQPTVEIDLGKALRLDNRLKSDLATFARGSPETDLIRGIRQLGAMILTVQSDPEINVLNILLPVRKLHDALVDLCAGGRPSLLFNAPRPPGFATKQKVSSAHYPQGVLAIGYAALVERGKYKPAKAIVWFTDMLKARTMPACGKDVRGWYNQCNAPKGRPAAGLIQAFRDYRPQLPNLHNATEAEDFATKCVAAVHGMRPERLKLRKHLNPRKRKTA